MFSCVILGIYRWFYSILQEMCAQPAECSLCGALLEAGPWRPGGKASPAWCMGLPGGGGRGLRLWVLGRPGLVCLLSWASSQRPLPFFLGWRQPLQWGRAQGTWRRWPLRQPSSCDVPTVPGYWMVGPPSAWPPRLRVMPSRQPSSFLLG